MRGQVNVERLEPGDDMGRVRCRECGLEWVTTPEQDALLADLFAHEAAHTGNRGTGTGDRGGGD
jgi:hypothetical protein